MPTVPTTGATVQPEPADLTGDPVSRDPLTIDIPSPIPPHSGDAPTPDDLEQFGDDDFEALNEQKIEAAGLLNAMPDDDGTTLDFPPTNDTPSFDHSFALIDPDAYDSVDNDGITRLTNINNFHSPGQNSIREIENEVRTASIQAGLPYQFTQGDRGVNYTIERRPGVGDFITARNGVKEAAPIGLEGFLNEETGEILPIPASDFDAELRKIIEDPTHPEMSDFLLTPTGGAGQGLTEEEKAGLKDFIERLPVTIGDLPDAFVRGGLKTLVEAFAASPLAQFVDPASIQKARDAIKASSEFAAAEGVQPTGVETLSSFIVAFNPIVRALRLAGVVGPLSTIVAFGLVKAVADNPDDPNLANLIVQMMGEEEPVEEGVARPLGGAEIAQAIAAFLSTEIGSSEETRAERSLREMLNRIRNFAVGSLEGVAIETVLAPFRILKRSTPKELEVHAANVDKTIDELRAARAARQRPEETSKLLASGEAAFQQDVGTVSRTLGIPPEEAERLLQAAAERGVGMEGAIIEGGGRVVHASKTPTAVSRPPSPVETPAPKNQEEIARVRNIALKAVNRTTGRLVKNTVVVNGLASHLRMSAATAPKSVERIPKADLVPQIKAPANREKVYENMDRVKGNHPDAMSSTTAYAAMQAEAFGIRDVPLAPERLIHIVNNPATSVKELRLLSNKQRSDAADGMALAAKARKIIEDGKWPVIATVQNFLWGSLSKGVTPFVQESSFLDVARRATPLFNRAIKGNFTEADLSKWEKLGDLIFTKGSGRPGEGARANFNAFGKQFLLKLSKKDKDGVTIIQKIHDLFTDLNKTGPQVRREILALAPGSGFDGKVLSFNLLGSGRTDVMVVDRVMFENLYNHKNKFDGINLYDGFKEKRMVRNKKTGKLGEKMATVNGSEGASIFFGPRGLLHYEVMEEGLAKVVPDIYRKLGRPGDGTLGNWHWENWVLKSGQSVGHPTLDTLVKSAEGDPAAFRDMTIENGKFDTYGSSGRWTIDGSGRGVYTYRTADGTPYKFSPMRFKELQKEFKNPKNGVVPKGFKVSDHTKEPWFESKEVDLGKRDEIVRRLGRPVGGDGGGDEPLPGGPIGPRGGGGEAGPESGKVRIKGLVAEGREPPTLQLGDPVLETPEPDLDIPPPPGDDFVSIEDLYREALKRRQPLGAPEPTEPEPELDLDLPPRPPEVPPRNRRASDNLEVVKAASNTPPDVPLTPGLQAYMDDNKRILGRIMNRTDFQDVDLNVEARLKAEFRELEGQMIELPDKIGGMRLKPLVTLGDEALTIPIIQSLGRVLADKVFVPPVDVMPEGHIGSVGIIPENYRGGLDMDMQFSPAITSDQFFTNVPHEVGHAITYRLEQFRKLLLQERRSDKDLDIMAGIGIVPIEDAEVMARDLNFERFTAAFQELFGDSKKVAENRAGIILDELELMSRMRRRESWDAVDEGMEELAKHERLVSDTEGSPVRKSVTSNMVYLLSTAELTGDGMASFMERPVIVRETAPEWAAFVKKLVNEDPLISRILYILGLSSIMLPGVPELLEEIDSKTLEGDDGGST